MTEHDDTDDRSLRSFADLDAWAPPPPPAAGALADAVVAQMRTPAGAADREHTASPPPSRRSLGVAAAVAAGVAVAAAGVLIILHWSGDRGREHEPETLPVGAADPSLEKMQQEVRELRARLDAAEQALAENGATDRPAGPAPASPPTRTASSSRTPPAAACDATALDEQGRERFAAGQLAAALTLFERSLACKPSLIVEQRAFLAACNLRNLPVASRYYARFSEATRARVVMVCVRNGITEDDLLASAPSPAPAPAPSPAPTPAPTPAPAPKACDAAELADRGKDAFLRGSHAEALQHYEAAIACSPEAGLYMKAFVVACNLQNTAKASAFYARMTPAQRMPAVNVCVRNGITEDDLEAARPGKLVITTSPPARVFIDGKEVGTSPITVEVSPGRHRVSLVVGSDKYTYATMARAGETVTMHKDLGNP
jgi:tetratricopeptide (TPR) repeat protein